MNASFANILLSGPCNLRCPTCIGRRFAPLPNNLDRYPLAGLERFVQRVSAAGIAQVSITGTNTDPLLYRHHERVVRSLRQQIPGLSLSLHTNGLLALRRRETIQLYDRATVSFCSFDSRTCLKMTGSDHVLDIRQILRTVRVPLKLSVLVTEHNAPELATMIPRIRALGWQRLVLRRPFGENGRWGLLDHPLLGRRRPKRLFGGNPVYQLGRLEVTAWDFERTTLGCLNLFSDGRIGDLYLISPREQVRARSGITCSPEVAEARRWQGLPTKGYPTVTRGGVTPPAAMDRRRQ